MGKTTGKASDAKSRPPQKVTRIQTNLCRRKRKV